MGTSNASRAAQGTTALPPPGSEPSASLETIVAAAHLYHLHDSADPRAVPVIVSAPPPARHHNLFALVGGKAPDESGFLTSTGRFAGRAEALFIAKRAGPTLIDHPSRHPTHLFSEDLW